MNTENQNCFDSRKWVYPRTKDNSQNSRILVKYSGKIQGESIIVFETSLTDSYKSRHPCGLQSDAATMSMLPQ